MVSCVYWKSYYIVGYIENSMDWNHFNIIFYNFFVLVLSLQNASS